MTDPQPRNTLPRLNLSAREWKLFVIGGLGVAYAASLSVVATQSQQVASQAAAAAPTTLIASGNPVVWLDQLAVSQRPTVPLPQGSTIATSTGQAAIDQSSVAGATTPSNAPVSTPMSRRILTRTS